MRALFVPWDHMRGSVESPFVSAARDASGARDPYGGRARAVRAQRAILDAIASDACGKGETGGAQNPFAGGTDGPDGTGCGGGDGGAASASGGCYVPAACDGWAPGGGALVGPGGETVGYLAHGTAADALWADADAPGLGGGDPIARGRERERLEGGLGVPFVSTWEIYGDEDADWRERERERERERPRRARPRGGHGRPLPPPPRPAHPPTPSPDAPPTPQAGLLSHVQSADRRRTAGGDRPLEPGHLSDAAGERVERERERERTRERGRER